LIDARAVLPRALHEDAFINHRGLRVNAGQGMSLPDIEGIDTRVTTRDIIGALRDSHAG